MRSLNCYLISGQDRTFLKCQITLPCRFICKGCVTGHRRLFPLVLQDPLGPHRRLGRTSPFLPKGIFSTQSVLGFLVISDGFPFVYLPSLFVVRSSLTSRQSLVLVQSIPPTVLKLSSRILTSTY